MCMYISTCTLGESGGVLSPRGGGGRGLPPKMLNEPLYSMHTGSLGVVRLFLIPPSLGTKLVSYSPLCISLTLTK